MGRFRDGESGMMEIEVLGTGCQKCRQMLANVERAVREVGLKAEVRKIEDIGAIVDRGIMLTPALVIDGEVVVSGKVPTVDDVKALLSR